MTERKPKLCCYLPCSEMIPNRRDHQVCGGCRKARDKLTTKRNNTKRKLLRLDPKGDEYRACIHVLERTCSEIRKYRTQATSTSEVNPKQEPTAMPPSPTSNPIQANDPFSKQKPTAMPPPPTAQQKDHLFPSSPICAPQVPNPNHTAQTTQAPPDCDCRGCASISNFIEVLNYRPLTRERGGAATPPTIEASLIHLDGTDHVLNCTSTIQFGVLAAGNGVFRKVTLVSKGSLSQQKFDSRVARWWAVQGSGVTKVWGVVRATSGVTLRLVLDRMSTDLAEVAAKATDHIAPIACLVGVFTGLATMHSNGFTYGPMKLNNVLNWSDQFVTLADPTHGEPLTSTDTESSEDVLEAARLFVSWVLDDKSRSASMNTTDKSFGHAFAQDVNAISRLFEYPSEVLEFLTECVVPDSEGRPTALAVVCRLSTQVMAADVFQVLGNSTSGRGKQRRRRSGSPATKEMVREATADAEASLYAITIAWDTFVRNDLESTVALDNILTELSAHTVPVWRELYPGWEPGTGHLPEGLTPLSGAVLLLEMLLPQMKHADSTALKDLVMVALFNVCTCPTVCDNFQGGKSLPVTGTLYHQLPPDLRSQCVASPGLHDSRGKERAAPPTSSSSGPTRRPSPADSSTTTTAKDVVRCRVPPWSSGGFCGQVLGADRARKQTERKETPAQNSPPAATTELQTSTARLVEDEQPYSRVRPRLTTTKEAALTVFTSFTPHGGYPAVEKHGCLFNFQRATFIFPFSPAPTEVTRVDEQVWPPSYGQLPGQTTVHQRPACTAKKNQTLYCDLVLMTVGPCPSRIKSWLEDHAQAAPDERDWLFRLIIKRAAAVVVLWDPDSASGAVVSAELFDEKPAFNNIKKLKLLIESSQFPAEDVALCRDACERSLRAATVKPDAKNAVAEAWKRNQLEAAITVAESMLAKRSVLPPLDSTASPTSQLASEGVGCWNELRTNDSVTAAVRDFVRMLKHRPKLMRALRRPIPSCQRVTWVDKQGISTSEDWNVDRPACFHPSWSGIPRMHFLREISGSAPALHLCAVAQLKGIKTFLDRLRHAVH